MGRFRDRHGAQLRQIPSSPTIRLLRRSGGTRRKLVSLANGAQGQYTDGLARTISDTTGGVHLVLGAFQGDSSEMAER